MDESGVRIITRSFDPDTDLPMIYSTWRNSSYYSAAIPPKLENEEYFKHLTKKIGRILRQATVKIACLEDSPITIIGYVVYTGDHLDWIYVKAGIGDQSFRNKGIARMLMPKDIKTVTSDLTKTGLEIVQNKKMTVKGD